VAYFALLPWSVLALENQDDEARVSRPLYTDSDVRRARGSADPRVNASLTRRRNGLVEPGPNDALTHHMRRWRRVCSVTKKLNSAHADHRRSEDQE
jgi:hypothetical protein